MDKLFTHVFLVIIIASNANLSAAPTFKEKLATGLAAIFTTASAIIVRDQTTKKKSPKADASPHKLNNEQQWEWETLHSSMNQQDYPEAEWKLYRYLKDQTNINTGFYSISFDKCKRDLKLDEDSLVATLENANRKLNSKLAINDFTFTATSGKSHRYLGFEIRKAHYAQDAAAGINRIEEAIKQSVYD